MAYANISCLAPFLCKQLVALFSPVVRKFSLHSKHQLGGNNKDKRIMSQETKPLDEYRVEMDDELDSFHSFVQSDVEFDDWDSLSKISDDVTTTDEIDLDIKQIMKVKKSMFNAADSSSSSTCSKDEQNFNISYFDAFPATRTLKPVSKYPTRLLQNLGDHHLVPELSCDSPMPGMELFDMNEPSKLNNNEAKTTLKTADDNESDALQKFAFTEIWVERQLNNPERKRKFTSALEAYFHKENIEELQKLKLGKQMVKGTINKQLFVNPAQSSCINSENFQSLPEFDTPALTSKGFPDIKRVEKELPGQKSYITVPAGFDLTNLVQYKNPNHWHRRSTTRNDIHP